MRYAVIVPVFNEKSLLPRLMARIDATPTPKDSTGASCERFIVVVDDGSTDGTRDEIVAIEGRDDVVARYHDRNRGKGAALRTGFSAALEAHADVVIIQDADLEYDPADHRAVLAPILDGRADAVIGSRFIGGTHRVLYYWHYVANRCITMLSNMLTNLNLTDIECCLKAFTSEAAHRISIREDRFGVEPEIVAKLSRLRIGGRRARVFEVPVSYAGRTYEEGKKITWRDGISAIRCIFRYNLLG